MNLQEGAAMKPVETPIRGAEPISALKTPLGGDPGRTLRQAVPSRFSPSLVTLWTGEGELDVKQRVMAEQFRLLRTRVKALTRDLQLRTMLITSALPGEGKTTIAANLAGSLSRIEGLRVLLMDFDLRHPTLHTLFGVAAEPASPLALSGARPWQESLYRVNPRLDALFGFCPLDEPDRLLQGTALETLIDQAKAHYDVVILDSAPMLAVADTQSLVPLVDCALFVVNADTTPVSAAKEALGMLQDKVAGCIVNRVEPLKSEGYYRSSNYGYGYESKRTEN